MGFSGLDVDDKPQVPTHLTLWFEWASVLGCLAIGWLLWTCLSPPLLSGEHAAYTESLARAILSGQASSLIHSPVALTGFSQPPLYPYLLSFLVHVLDVRSVPDTVRLLMQTHLALYLLSIGLMYAFANSRIRKPVSFLVTLLYAVAPITMIEATSFTADILFVVLSLLAILSIDKYLGQGEEVGKPWTLVSSCLFTALAIYTKNLGYVLLLAFMLVSIQRVSFQKLFGFLLILGLTLLPWHLQEFYQQYVRGNHLHQTQSQLQQTGRNVQHTLGNATSRKTLMGQIVFHVQDAVFQITETTLGTLNLSHFNGYIPKKLEPNRWVFHFSTMPYLPWLVGFLLMIGLYYAFYQYSGVSGSYVLLFMTATAIWPAFSPNSLMPVFPMLLLMLFIGVVRVCDFLNKLQLPMMKVAIPAVAGVVAASSLSGHLDYVSGNPAYSMVQLSVQPEVSQSAHRDDRLIGPTLEEAAGKKEVTRSRNAVTSQPTAPPVPLNSPENGYLKALAWLKDHTDSDNNILARNPADIYEETQRSAVAFPQNKDAAIVWRAVQQADYVLEETHSHAVKTFLTPVLELHRGELRQVYADPLAEIRIWQVNS